MLGICTPGSSGAAIHGVNPDPGTHAGFFEGHVEVQGGDLKVNRSGVGGDISATGTISAAVKHFVIDHPCDPTGKYLDHSSVESSEMLNIYSGNVVTDQDGDAAVVLPDYFDALNADFRYHLTVIGQFAQAIITREMENNRFGIKTDKPHVKVSWQVAGIRHDAYARANPLVVEREKPAGEKGSLLHPEVRGQKDFGSQASSASQASTARARVAVA